MTPADARSAAREAAAREAARGTGLILFGAAVSQAIEYLYRFALARGLGVEGFGTFSQARSALLVLAVLAALGIGPGVKRFIALQREAGKGAEARRAIRDGARVNVLSALAGGVALYFLAGPLAAAYRNPDLLLPVRVLAFALPLRVGLDFVTPIGESVRSFRATVLARQILDPSLRFLSTVVLLLAGAGLPAIMGAYAGSLLVALVLATILVARLDPVRQLARGDAPSQLGGLLRFSLPLVAGGVFFDLAERTDVLMIGLYQDEGQVGIYASGSAIARSLLLLFGSTMPVIGTLAAEAVGREARGDMAHLLRRTSRWMLFFTAPIACGFFLYAREVISILFGREFAGAALTLRVLIPAYLATVLAGPLALFTNALGKTHWTLGTVALRTLVNVALNLVLIPRFGIVGAAAGTLIALLVSVVVHGWQLRSLVPLRGVYSGWGRPVAVMAVAMGVSWGVSRLILATGLGGGDADLVAGLMGGVVLLAVFWIGARTLPGCIREGDLALIGFLRERIGR